MSPALAPVYLRTHGRVGPLTFCGALRPRPFLLAALLCGGCAHYAPLPLVPTQAERAWGERSLDDPALRRFVATAQGGATPQVWDVDTLTLAALYEQPGLAVARAQWEVAAAGVLTAGQRPNPSLSVGATYDTTTPPPWIPAVSFDVPIETAGKRGHRLAQARQLAAAARWDWVDKVWQVRAGVRSALLNVYAARESAELLDRQAAAQAEVARLLEGQLRAGAIPATDLTQARIALDTTRLSLQQARQQQTEAVAALADAVGLPTAALANVELSFTGLDRFPPPVRLSAAERDAVIHRADVRSALASYAASEAALQLEVANQYPDIHLGPGYELDQVDNKWSLGVTLPLPLLNRNEGPIAEAEAKRRLAAAQFVATQAKALNEVELALAGYHGAVEQSDTAAALLRELDRRRGAVRAMRQAGEVDALAVAAADVEYATGAALHLDAIIKVQQALGRLEAAIQSPLVIPDAVLREAAAPVAANARSNRNQASDSVVAMSMGGDAGHSSSLNFSP